ncbi:GNAT family N-acetyltransferase [Marinilactibacillus sp. Marseille-P9653]|uniref:GNAT family N-acetyltransferase n=1 Tax=Marinilactibacillus sp. Marseille-P9653 TaxID=2866583 RepID=UPI001CE44A3F|nr:GNAT family N-acetyltransferase [Marinilactibacillus sp. Marseille-P9653]
MAKLDTIYIKHHTIETDRLLLRPVTLDDAEDMYEYASDEQTVFYVFKEIHQSVEDTEDNIVAYFLKDPIGKYAMEVKETGKMIGTIDLRAQEKQFQAEIGYIMNKAYHGKGYMTEAGKALIKLGFETLGLERIYALHDERNAASGKVMQRLGMTKEGTLRHASKDHEGTYVNDVYYSMLKKEYRANQDS